MSTLQSPTTPAGSRIGIQYQALTSHHSLAQVDEDDTEMADLSQIRSRAAAGVASAVGAGLSTALATSAIATEDDNQRRTSTLAVPEKGRSHTRTRSEGTLPRMFSFQVGPANTNMNGVHIDIQPNNTNTIYDAARRTSNVGSDIDAASDIAINGSGENADEEATFLQTHLKSIIYGGLDGIITTFATVTSVAGADLSVLVIIVLGIAHLFADGLSMGMGDMISESSELEHTQVQRKRLSIAYDRDRVGCERRLVSAYLRRGISAHHATRLVSYMSEHQDLLIDTLMVETCDMLPEHVPTVDEDEQDHDIDNTMNAQHTGFFQRVGLCCFFCCFRRSRSGGGCVSRVHLSGPLRAGLITMFSFILFGSIPLLPYIIVIVPFIHFELEPHSQLVIAVITTVITLFLLGVIKAALVNSTDDDIPSPSPLLASASSSCCGRVVSCMCSPRALASLWSGFVMALNGSVAAAIGFAIGWILKESIDAKIG